MNTNPLRMFQVGNVSDFQTPQKPLFPSEKRWPTCSSQEVFIWEAIAIVGQAILPDEWDGSELNALDWPLSPERGLEQAKEKRRAQIAGLGKTTSYRPAGRVGLGRQQSKLPAPPVSPPVNYYDQHMVEWAKHDFSQQLGQLQHEWERNRCAVERIYRACAWIDEHVRDGVVRSLTKLVGTAAAPMDMPPSEWFCDDPIKERMFPGQYKRWYYQPTIQQLPVYIFLDRRSLVAALGVKTQPQIAGLDIQSLSPFLQLAIRVAFDEGVTAETGVVTTDKKQVIIDAINAAKSTYDLDDQALGERAVDYLATFIRWPEARLGRAKGKG